MSTGDAILPPSIPPPWFDETPPPPPTTHDEILPLSLSFNETPPIKTAHAPETPTAPSLSKRWRSGTLHLETPVLKRWRSGTLHPETPVATTASPGTAKRRRRAGVLRALRPCRRLQGKQPDPSEVIVKRPRLAPARVMSTTLVKSNERPLGVDEGGPTSDENFKKVGDIQFLS